MRLFFLTGWSLLWTKGIIKPAYVLIMSFQSILSKEYKKKENIQNKIKFFLFLFQTLVSKKGKTDDTIFFPCVKFRFFNFYITKSAYLNCSWFIINFESWHFDFYSYKRDKLSLRVEIWVQISIGGASLVSVRIDEANEKDDANALRTTLTLQRKYGLQNLRINKVKRRILRK